MDFYFQIFIISLSSVFFNHLHAVCKQKVVINACNSVETGDADYNETCSKESADAAVFINNQYYGKTNANGQIVIDLDFLKSLNNTMDGKFLLSVIDRINSYGYSNTLEIPEYGSTFNISLYNRYTEPFFLSFSGFENYALLPNDFSWSNLTIFFYELYRNNNLKLNLYEIRDITIESSLFPGTEDSILNFFEINQINNNEINIIDDLALKSKVSSLPSHGAIIFKFYVDLEIENSIYYQISNFNVYISEYSISGFIVPPINHINIDLNSVNLNIKNSKSDDIDFDIVVNTNGSFSTVNLPKGTYFIFASIVINNVQYIAEGSFLLTTSSKIKLNLISPNEKVNNVQSFFDITYSKKKRDLLDNDNFLIKKRNSKEKRAVFEPKINGYDVYVEASSMNYPVTKYLMYEINPGIHKIKLMYEVMSKEYPYYVKSQSIFNDVWSVQVIDMNGKNHFKIQSDVNYMLYNEPLWQDDSHTNIIEQIITVKVSVPTDLYLIVTATNIGDSTLPTAVSAKLIILDEKIENVKLIDKCIGCKLKRNDMISFPGLNKKNFYQRYINVKYKVSTNEAIQNIEVYIVPDDLLISPLKIINGSIGDDGISIINEGLIEIRISFNNPNTLISFNQKFKSFKIKVIFKVLSIAENNMYFMEQLSDDYYYALWPAPFSDDISKRFSIRNNDVGGDNWASLQMCKWLETNTNLWTRYNDISGEHSNDLALQFHDNGNYVNVFHYYAFSNKANFGIFVNKVIEININSPNKDPESVTDWIIAHRDAFDLLDKNKDVIEFSTHFGNELNGLPKNWLRTLMNTGKLGDTIDLNIGTWKTPKKSVWSSDYIEFIQIKIN